MNTSQNLRHNNYIMQTNNPRTLFTISTTAEHNTICGFTTV